MSLRPAKCWAEPQQWQRQKVNSDMYKHRDHNHSQFAIADKIAALKRLRSKKSSPGRVPQEEYLRKTMSSPQKMSDKAMSAKKAIMPSQHVEISRVLS
ncbi:hypothetical protein Ddc_15692 [Ditylenchus destructor]|nr:hypothetical protein Ddc_15692 [Ditylenchus destructor]